MIGILDYGFGNIQSVHNAIYFLGMDPLFVRSQADFSEVSHLIIPGVGAFDAAMEELRRRELYSGVLKFAQSGKALLGICLGMQLLADFGVEGSGSEGLKLIPSEVKKFEFSEVNLSIPHCGWNTTTWHSEHPVLKGIPPNVDYYFVHSYIMKLKDSQYKLGTTDYGGDFVSVCARDNIVGMQFHPEKSQRNGLKLLSNFCSWAV